MAKATCLCFCSAEPGSGQALRANLNGRFNLEPSRATPELETVTTTAERNAGTTASTFQHGHQQGASAAPRDQVLPGHVSVHL